MFLFAELNFLKMFTTSFSEARYQEGGKREKPRDLQVCVQGGFATGGSPGARSAPHPSHEVEVAPLTQLPASGAQALRRGQGDAAGSAGGCGIPQTGMQPTAAPLERQQGTEHKWGRSLWCSHTAAP